MAEYLYAAAEPPSVGELIEAGWHAIAAHIDAERQFHGRARDRPGPITSFERYWRAVAAPDDSPEAKVTDRIALTQIWPRLRPALSMLKASADPAHRTAS